MSTATRYHINKANKPGICKAKRNCPLGGEHYASKEATQAALEAGVEYVAPVRTSRSVSGSASKTTKNETYAVEALVAYSKNQPKSFNASVAHILALEEDEKFLAYRGKDMQHIISSLYSLYQSIATHSGVKKPVLDAPIGNRNGSDITVPETGGSYELKFGAATDVNPGAGVVAKYLLGAYGNHLPSADDRNRWRVDYFKDPVQQKREHDAKLQHFVAEYSKEVGKAVPASGSRLLYSYFYGITNSEEALANDGKAVRQVTRLTLKEDSSGHQEWVPEGRPVIDQSKEWVVSSVEWTDKNRAVIGYRHPSGWSAKFVYNYKNKYSFKKDGAVTHVADAMQGLGGPSYNVWFREPTLP